MVIGATICRSCGSTSIASKWTENQTLRQALVHNEDTSSIRAASIHVVAWAKHFLFQPEQSDTPLKFLSGGERCDFLIARLMTQRGRRAAAGRTDERSGHSVARSARGSLMDFAAVCSS